MKTSPRGRKLIKDFEGFSGTAYRCPAGVVTIGYGFTKGVKLGDRMTRAEADHRLADELDEYERAVLRATGGNCNQNEFDAIVCFAWNVGIGGMMKSTVIKAHNRGEHDAAARAFGLWNKAAGRVMTGLTRRRAAEAALYLEPMHDEVSEPMEGPVQPMPQAVEPETRLRASPLISSTTLSTGAGTLAVISEGARSAADIRESIGDWLPYILVAVAIGAGGYAIWMRVRQRKLGWA